MFCRHCGAQINDNAKFCDQCGQTTYLNTQPVTPQVPTPSVAPQATPQTAAPKTNTTHNIYESATLSRHNCSKSIVLKNLLMLPLILVIIIAEIRICDIIFYQEGIDLVNWLNICVIVDIVWCFFSLYNIIQAKKCFVSITENGVYGVGTSNNLLTVKPFALTYSEITRVYAETNTLTIENGGVKIVSPVSKSYIALGLIRKLAKADGRNRQTYTWHCEKCGAINKTTGINCPSCGAKRKTSNLQQTFNSLIKDLNTALSCCSSKTDFIAAMAKFGYDVNWNDYEESIRFTTPDGTCISDTDIPDEKFRKKNLESILVN